MLFLLYIKIKLENMIKIMPTFNPVFRPEKEEPEKIVETYFSSEEKNNTVGNGDFMIKLLNKDNQEKIGTMTYDYDENPERPMIKIRTVGVDLKYQRQDFSKKMYQFLIDLAKSKCVIDSTIFEAVPDLSYGFCTFSICLTNSVERDC